METIETVRTSAPLFDKGKLFVKSIFIFAMTLALWLPTYFILGIVKERAGRQKEAIADISSKWAGKQSVTGPILKVPFNEVETDQIYLTEKELNALYKFDFSHNKKFEQSFYICCLLYYESPKKL